MKRIEYFLLVMILLLSFNVKAADDNCDPKELTRVKEIAKKVEFDYDYKLVDDKPVFSIEAINLNQDIKVKIVENYYNDIYREFVNTGNNRGKLDNFEAGERVTVTITAYVPNWCSGKTVLTRTVKLPYYNKFYNEERCNGNEDFKYCKQLIDSNISEKTFENEFAKYLKNKNTTNDTEQVQNDNKMTYIIIGVVSLIVAIGAIVLIVRNISRIKKKNSL